MSIESRKWIISTGLAVAALIVPIAIFILSAKDKSLKYEITSHSELVGEEIPVEGLEIKIKGETVGEISIHSLKISNSGSKPILANDFEKPLSLYVEDNTKIFAAKVKRSHPENLSLTHRIRDNYLLFDPLLLNPGDEFELDFYSSSNKYPEIDARIAGISEVNRVFPESKAQNKRIIIAVLGFFLLVYYGKTARLLISSIGYLSKPPIRMGDIVLTLTCGFSSAFLLLSEFEIKSNFLIFYILTLIPIVLGFLWGRYEREYNKKMQPTADASADL